MQSLHNLEITKRWFKDKWKIEKGKLVGWLTIKQIEGQNAFLPALDKPCKYYSFITRII